MITAKYINRDISWMEFNKRVLEEAKDENNPLLERLKFLAIVSSNFDEFMSIRVSGIQGQLEMNPNRKDFSGSTPESLLKRINKRFARMTTEQYKTFRELIREMNREGVELCTYKDLNEQHQYELDQYFNDIIFPVLTPMAVDQSRPFPLVHSLQLYLAVVLRPESEIVDDEDLYFAIVQVPSNLSRLVTIPSNTKHKNQRFMFLEELIKQHVNTLFPGYVPIAVNRFRLTRDAEIILNEEESEDLLADIEKELRKRRWGDPVRLEVDKNIHPWALELLKEEFNIDEHVILTYIDGPIDLTFCGKLPGMLKGFDKLSYPRMEPIYPVEFAENQDFFSVLKHRDVLVHHPYESFQVVTDFICKAAVDPNVLAIKMTLYRVNGGSSLIKALVHAAESGKQVTVGVELKARFDEERNIAWARELEKAGCHVVYGLVGLKTHAKVTLVIRQEKEGLRQYIHIGTGNYNENTARLYTDIGLFTSHPIIGSDATMLFNEITGYSAPRSWEALAVAPSHLKNRLFSLIRQETAAAKAGKPARIIAKMNSLSHQDMIDELYQASQEGVKIDLIIRGVCCLRPGVPGLSENIRVISIVDRYLEHSRIFYFENGGDYQMWISSADWMTRNLVRRIELMCPVFDEPLRETIMKILQLSLCDNVKARQLTQNGEYVFVKNDLPALRSQFEALNIETWKTSFTRFEEVGELAISKSF